MLRNRMIGQDLALSEQLQARNVTARIDACFLRVLPNEPSLYPERSANLGDTTSMANQNQ